MKHLLFSERTKLADIIHADYRLLFVLPRFGIRLGFGEKSIAEICRRQGIDPHLFLMICNVYTFHEYLPGEEELAGIDTEQLILYLQNSHRDYMDSRIPGLQTRITEMTRGCKSNSQVLDRFFDGYSQEVIKHFEYEETTVFPYIRQLSGLHTLPENYRIGQFEKLHTNIEDKLTDLKNIIIKYLPEECSPELRNQVLLDLFLLEDDLNKHSLIEDKILVPIVLKMEETA